jgi:hypothetical protein
LKLGLSNEMRNRLGHVGTVIAWVLREVLVDCGESYLMGNFTMFDALHLLKTYLNIILPSTPGSPQWSLSLRLPHQMSVYTSPFPHTCYMLRPSHSSRFCHPNNIWLAVQIIKLLIM